MSDTAAEGTQAATGGDQAAAPTVDLSPVLERIEDLGEQFQSFQQGAGDQQFAGSTGGYDYGFDPYGAQPQEPGFQYGEPAYGDPQQQGLDPNMGQDQALGMLNQLIGQAVQQATSPLMQRLDAQEIAKHEQALAQQRDALLQKYPELGGEQGQQFTQKTSEQANGLAAALAPLIDPSASPQEHQAIANDLGRLIAGHPMFSELAYLASKAQESAAQEEPASTGQEFNLEPGGGAAQQAQQESSGSQYLGLGQDRPQRSLGDLF